MTAKEQTIPFFDLPFEKALSDYRWRDDGWMSFRRQSISADEKKRPISAYGVHLDFWQRGACGSVVKFHEVASELACYVKQMGHTHVVLFSVTERTSFASDEQGRSAVWEMPAARYGTPQDFMGFVDSMHEAGIGVVVEWPCCQEDTLTLANISQWIDNYHVDGFFVGKNCCFFDSFLARVRDRYSDIVFLLEDDFPHGDLTQFDLCCEDVGRRLACAKIAYGYQMLCAGNKRMPMGCEIGQPFDRENNRPLDWSLLNRPPHAALQFFAAAINHFCLEYSVGWNCGLPQETDLSAALLNGDSGVFSCPLISEQGETFYIVLNTSLDVRYGYELAVSCEGEYEELLNSDLRSFGGSGIQNGVVSFFATATCAPDPAIRITVPPLALCVFRQKRTP